MIADDRRRSPSIASGRLRSYVNSSAIECDHLRSSAIICETGLKRFAIKRRIIDKYKKWKTNLEK